MKNKMVAKTMEEWAEYYREQKKKHPIRYWLIERYENNWYPIQRAYIKVYDYFRYRIKRYQNVYTGLTPCWYDRDYLMLVACFTILKDYVEKERPDEMIDWSHNEEHQKAWDEIQSLYKWWKIDRPTRESIEENLYNSLQEYKPEKREEIIKIDREIYKQINQLEKDWEKEDNENLMRLIKIRGYLWT